MNDYIFCPFCGESKWISDKTGNYNGSKLESHKCTGCKKFNYTTIINYQLSPKGIEFFNKKMFSVVAHVEPYIISVFHHKVSTQFQDSQSREVILVLDQAINFNWYRSEELAEKVKTYVVFS